MTSPKKIEANRRNGQKSRGPKTKEGRDVSRMNALKHGLCAQKLVVFDEDPKELDNLRRELFKALDPADAFEVVLVENIVMAQWHLRRSHRAQADLFTRLGGNEELGGVFDGAPAQVAALQRYCGGIERSLHRNVAALERRQARRRGEAVPVPMSIVLTEANEPDEAPVAPAKARRTRDAGGHQISFAYPSAPYKSAAVESGPTGILGTQTTAHDGALTDQQNCETNPPAVEKGQSKCAVTPADTPESASIEIDPSGPSKKEVS